MSYCHDVTEPLPCGHYIWTWYGWKSDGNGGYYLGVSLESHVAKRCCTCGAWLSLGPANDDDERVRIEVRAAELVAVHDDCLTHYTMREFMGWIVHEEGWVLDALNDEQLAGYLARAIATHDEQGADDDGR